MSSFYLLPQGAASHCSGLLPEERVQQNGACRPRADPFRTIKSAGFNNGQNAIDEELDQVVTEIIFCN